MLRGWLLRRRAAARSGSSRRVKVIAREGLVLRGDSNAPCQKYLIRGIAVCRCPVRSACLAGALSEVVGAACVLGVPGFDVGSDHFGDLRGELGNRVELAGFGAAGFDGAGV